MMLFFKRKKKWDKLPMIMVILDGWGVCAPSRGNAISLAGTPTLDSLAKRFPNTTILAHGRHAGLPDGQVGNSEAGHMNIGAGRVVLQDSVRITESIADGTFFKNPAFLEAIRHAEKNRSRVHIIGLLSNGMSPHSHPKHLLALIELMHQRNVADYCLHLFTDGRDSPKYSALKILSDLAYQYDFTGHVSTIMGRFYAMDRKKKWDRTEQAYEALVMGIGRPAKSATDAINQAYNRGESDEFIEPYVITDERGEKRPSIADNDSVIFFNLRSDRSRQLTKAFVQDKFNQMNPGSPKRRKVLENVRFVAMTDFGPDLGSILTAFPGIDIKNTLPMQLRGLRQLYIAENEKYAHVTYFFNGGYAGTVDGEEQFMVPSPDVKFYDETPEMSSAELTEQVISNVRKDKYDFTLLNFAAPDMVGHTGNLKAGVECCARVDEHIGRIVDEYLEKNGTVIITADHGNIEEMVNLETGEVDTEHSVNPVPFFLIGRDYNRQSTKLRDNGVLADIAPTILDILGIEKPKEMTGKSLINK